MSFLDDVVDLGTNLWDTVSGGGVVGGVIRSAALGYLVRQTSDSVKKDNAVPTAAQTQNATTPDYGVREQIDPNTDNSIPVVYGTAYLQGSIFDAVLTNGNQTMYYAIAICEKTGTLMSTGVDSDINFEEIYWNGDKINWQGDGITVLSQTNSEGTINQDMNGLVKFWLYNNGSTNQTGATGVGLPGGVVSAFNVFPNWTSAHTMENLVFAIVRVDYSKAKNVTGLGRLEFKMKNTLTQPGDVLYDYMTNERYGAGIQAQEIYSS